MSFNLYSEILQEFDLAPTRKDKILVLQKHDSIRFRDFLVNAFNPDIQFDVTIPKYKPSLNPAGLNELYIDSQLSKIYRFVKDHPQRADGFGGIQQERILLVILEALHKDESELFCRMLEKNLNIKYLTPNLIREAYPGINL
jgi:hypothetical protein